MKFLIAAILVLFTFGGCSPSEISTDDWNKVSEGMTRDEVRSILGAPIEEGEVKVFGESRIFWKYSMNGEMMLINFSKQDAEYKLYRKAKDFAS
ncbi:MAG: hypothetical protein CMJ71_07270 [Planctomycetaceae bacterium]|nr:hypothetical protein [Planctomycetaceae bacterium]